MIRKFIMVHIISFLCIIISNIVHCSVTVRPQDHHKEIPYEVKTIIFFDPSFLSKKNLCTIRSLSAIWNTLIEKTQKYKDIFKQVVISDIKGLVFNTTVAEVSPHYLALYKKYFFPYV